MLVGGPPPRGSALDKPIMHERVVAACPTRSGARDHWHPEGRTASLMIQSRTGHISVRRAAS